MNKRFNTTGTCIPKKHYMVNIENKLKAIEKLVHQGDYFIINRPRQYGKTTTMYLLTQRLHNEYLVIKTSFEGIGDVIFSSEENFCRDILDIFADSLEFVNEEKSEELRALGTNLKSLKEVSRAITKFVKNSDKEVILLIDEVDKSSNNQLFLSFLGMLRNKFLLSQENIDATFKSVILAGVHDIKNLKLKIIGNDEKKMNSPWNIAIDFNIDMSFNPYEIKTMLEEYCSLNKLDMDTAKLSENLYYYTNGYPFLVSRLCKIIDEDILKNKIPWELNHIIKAIKLILKENSTLFDDLIKNLENNMELNNYVFDIVFNGENKVFNIHNPLINRGTLYGIFKEEDGIVKISNKIFEQVIYNYFISKLENNTSNIKNYNFRDNFINNDGSLDMEKILFKYQQFIKEQYSHKDAKFIEREGRLLFLAFIKPIINGVGFDFKEVQIAEEKRLDVVITYNNFKYVIELKVWYGQQYHEKGLIQLADYIDNQDLDKGYLIVYNFNKSKEYNQEYIKSKDKGIFVIYV
ncbi:AAA family ATPase [Clostridium gasigenes]|uniref:Predicted AAA-ATPase n=1 Tax=Clostridium gasigenes TaxID=94869 RepID=A0A1H0LY02_9CLOT|nr:AAA family ATPase [Clostridium gasigenes]MBB6622330.1 AAA family ATPase [Clostridium gasigenes]SDO73122.1 Predicted AAA-ATPase [Clostridium gasigenes]